MNVARLRRLGRLALAWQRLTVPRRSFPQFPSSSVPTAACAQACKRASGAREHARITRQGEVLHACVHAATIKAARGDSAPRLLPSPNSAHSLHLPRSASSARWPALAPLQNAATPTPTPLHRWPRRQPRRQPSTGQPTPHPTPPAPRHRQTPPPPTTPQQPQPGDDDGRNDRGRHGAAGTAGRRAAALAHAAEPHPPRAAQLAHAGVRMDRECLRLRLGLRLGFGLPCVARTVLERCCRPRSVPDLTSPGRPTARLVGTSLRPPSGPTLTARRDRRDRRARR